MKINAVQHVKKIIGVILNRTSTLSKFLKLLEMIWSNLKGKNVLHICFFNLSHVEILDLHKRDRDVFGRIHAAAWSQKRITTNETHQSEGTRLKSVISSIVTNQSSNSSAEWLPQYSGILNLKLWSQRQSLTPSWCSKWGLLLFTKRLSSTTSLVGLVFSLENLCQCAERQK